GLAPHGAFTNRAPCGASPASTRSLHRLVPSTGFPPCCDNPAMNANDTPLPPGVADDLQRGLHAMGLGAALAPPLLAYLSLLVRWNRTYNLTAIRDPREMVTRHLLDSLAMAAHVESGTLADLGTGPGLPGIPLAIAHPQLQVTLVESNGKKARFLREAVR